MLVRIILEKYPDSFFHLMTPGGCVELAPEQVKGLLSGEGVKAHPGTAEYGIGIEAEELLNEKIHYIHWKDGVFGMLTDYLKSGEEPGEEPEGLRELERAVECGRKLREQLQSDYEKYIQKLRGMPAEELIGMAEEIAATKLIYEEFAVKGRFWEHAVYFVQSENPLELLRDRWRDYGGHGLHERMEDMLCNMQDCEISIGDSPMEGQAGESQEVVMC